MTNEVEPKRIQPGVGHDASNAGNPPKLVVLTGGPGAGKTAVLEVVRMHLPAHVQVLGEAASIVFGGGFPRRQTAAATRAAQRAIFHVQRELERLATEEGDARVVICDRGTLDGLAYWPGDPDELLREMGTTLAAELARYAAVIHLKTPSIEQGFSHASNPLRIESADEATRLDARIQEVWSSHPRRLVVESTSDFLGKLARVLAAIGAELDASLDGQRGR
ncbi:MAG TPA: ATP-binding protein [Byssovorax sp.]|jgi:predicted ATPase